MKIAILADLHIGYQRFADDAYAQARAALDTASGLADAVLIAGDVFDSRAPKPEALAQAMTLFAELSRRSWKAKAVRVGGSDNAQQYCSIPVVAISGTHERLAEGRANVLNLLGIAGMLVDTSEATTIISMDGERVAVFGLGGVSEERVRERLSALAPKPVAGAFNIFMFHQSVHELLPFDKDFIRLEELPEGFDLYVNGHIHAPYEGIARGKPFIIPGSTVITQLKEAEQRQKGFVLFDTTTLAHTFVGIDSRRFLMLKVEAGGKRPEEIERLCDEEIARAIEGAQGQRPILRLVVSGIMAQGHRKSELSPVRLAARYAQHAFVEIDASELVQHDANKSIEEIRSGRIGELSIKELGSLLLNERLKELGAEKGINYSLLFGLLACGTNKPEVRREVDALLLGGH